MLLSEMFGVREGQLFTTENYIGYEFCVESCEGVEHVKVKRESGGWSDVNLTMMEILIHLAPAGIIHLPPPLTDEQREQLKALYTIGYRWLAKDKYGSVYAYEEKPYEKSRDTWLCQGDLYLCYTKPTKYLEPLVSWSDPEPFDIGKALGVGG